MRYTWIHAINEPRNFRYLFYNNKNKAKIQGYITVNTETGEYIGHNLDGTEWLSRDLDPVQKNK